MELRKGFGALLAEKLPQKRGERHGKRRLKPKTQVNKLKILIYIIRMEFQYTILLVK